MGGRGGGGQLLTLVELLGYCLLTTECPGSTTTASGEIILCSFPSLSRSLWYQHAPESGHMCLQA